MHDISSGDEGDFFKSAPKKTVAFQDEPIPSASRTIASVTEKSDRTVWELKCKDLCDFLDGDRSDEDILVLMKTIFRKDVPLTQITIPVVLLLIFTEFRTDRHWETLLDGDKMTEWKEGEPDRAEYKKLKSVWETLPMQDDVTSLWTAWTDFIAVFRALDDVKTPNDWDVNCIADIDFQEPDTLRMSLSLPFLSVLRRSLKSLLHSLQCPEQKKPMVFGLSRPTTTTSTSRTRALFPTEAVDVLGSSTLPSGDDSEDLDFEDEISSLTSRLSTGAGCLDITLQTAESQYSLQAEKKMEDFVYELKIYR